MAEGSKVPEQEGPVRTARQAAAVLGITDRTLLRWRDAGCPGRGSDRRFDLEAIRAWAAAHHRTPGLGRGQRKLAVALLNDLLDDLQRLVVRAHTQLAKALQEGEGREPKG